jgi:hypothetical protein
LLQNVKKTNKEKFANTDIESLMERDFAMEIGENKAGYKGTDFYNKNGPITTLKAPTQNNI